MIETFRLLLRFFANHLLNPRNYKIIIKCNSLESQLRLEAAIKDEFKSISNDPHGSSAPRFNEGTILEIPFEVTT